MTGSSSYSRTVSTIFPIILGQETMSSQKSRFKFCRLLYLGHTGENDQLGQDDVKRGTYQRALSS